MRKPQKSFLHPRDDRSEPIPVLRLRRAIRVRVLADLERVKSFREAFLELLVHDPHVQARLDHCMEATGLMKAAQLTAMALDEPTFSEGLRALRSAIDRLTMMWKDMVAFVQDELHLPYPGGETALWNELFVRAFRGIYGDGRPPALSLEVCVSDPPAPSFELRGFKTEPDETRSEIERRLEELFNAERARLRDLCEVQGHVDPGRKRTKEVPGYAYWFYRNQVREESIQSLAQERHSKKNHKQADSDKCGCRSTIRWAIEQAKLLMNQAFPTI